MPVRVVLVLFRTWLNGWCTARRFQVKHAECLFGGRIAHDDECLDSIEHYAFCPVLAEFATRRLHLPSLFAKNMLGFLCLNRGVDDETRVLQLLFLHSVYITSNCIRFPNPPLKGVCIHELLLQRVHQAADHCSYAQNVVHKLVTKRWDIRRRTQ